MKKGQARYSRGYSPRHCPRSGKKKTFRKFKIIFAWILFLILVLAYILFLSPIFKIKEIKISDNRVISEEDIRNSLDNQNNLFLATNSKLRDILFNDFPRISSVDIDKDIFKKSIELKIVERKEVGIFCNQDCYYIDGEGVIFERAPQTSGVLILVIKDKSQNQAEIGKNVIPRELMINFLDLRNYLFSQLNLRAIDFIIESGISEDIRVNTNEGWYILFDKSRDLKNQLQALELVLKEKIGEERKNLEYIDLRIENRAYYK